MLSLRNNGVFLRFQHPAHSYDPRPFVHEDGVYLASDRYVYTVVKQSPEQAPDFRRDFFWISPEEVRLLSSLALSVPESHGALRFTPAPLHYRLPLEIGADLSAQPALEVIEREAKRLSAESFPNPPVYELEAHPGLEEETRYQLYAAIDSADDLMIRGLSTLLKCWYLLGVVGYSVYEEAFMNVQISREAALELIREHLRYAGNPNPSYRDAHEYLRHNFRYGEPLAAFFEDQHELWVSAKHPVSLYGPAWTPSIAADDIYETYEALVSVYRHVLLGEEGRASIDLE